MEVIFETDRFWLRKITENDVQNMFDLDSDSEVHKFLGNNPVKSKEESEKIIQHILNQYQTNGIGRLAIIDKITKNFIGWSGLKREEKVRDFKYYDLGYRLKKKYWGKGIATETAKASLKYGFEELNLNKIGAGAEAVHNASIKVLTKVGFNFVETFEYDNVLCNFYELTKVKWMGNKL